MSLDARFLSAVRMPQRKDNHHIVLLSVVDVVADAVDLKASSARQLRVLDALADTWLQSEHSECGSQVFAHGMRCCEAIGSPPRIRSLDLGRGSGGDSYASGHCFAARSRRAKSSSTEMVSPRSASAMDSRSSASSSGLSVNPSLGSRVKTVTTAPSGRVTPSTWTLPPTTVPVAIPMDGMVPPMHAAVRESLVQRGVSLNEARISNEE